jgi:hypothetical protein
MGRNRRQHPPHHLISNEFPAIELKQHPSRATGGKASARVAPRTTDETRSVVHLPIEGFAEYSPD